MTLTALLSLPVTITRRSAGTTEGQYGDLVSVEATTETVCELQQKTRDEPAGEGELSVTQWLLILPAETQIDTSDKITVEGRAYEMVGDPWHARNPRTGVEQHVEATVKRAGA